MVARSSCMLVLWRADPEHSGQTVIEVLDSGGVLTGGIVGQGTDVERSRSMVSERSSKAPLRCSETK